MHEGNMDHLVSQLKQKLSKDELALLIQVLEEGDGAIDILFTELVNLQQKGVNHG